ncbi:MAG: ATPase, T2SS/T4P/T4SS family [Succinivibrio sp.]|jgi:type IV secretion system protein VirB11|nr:ATPase, T2SS/T4P/T4SS family [Succinivibrio sp.]
MENIYGEVALRRLRTAFGPELLCELENPEVTEIMANSDCRVFTEGACGKRELAPITPQRTSEIIYTLSASGGAAQKADDIIVSCDLPFGSARFEGLLPPLCPGPCFSVRRHGCAGWDLAQLAAAGMLTARQLEILKAAVAAERSMIICGETGSGKTTLLGALLYEIKRCAPLTRVICLEDTPELKIPLDDHVSLTTAPGFSLSDLVRSTLRLNPRRIVVGEVRGAEALDLVDALSSGHQGSLATLHAGTAEQALRRLLLMVSRHPQCPRHIEPLVAQAVDLLVVLGTRPRRHVTQICAVTGFSGGEFNLKFMEK